MKYWAAPLLEGCAPLRVIVISFESGAEVGDAVLVSEAATATLVGAHPHANSESEMIIVANSCISVLPGPSRMIAPHMPVARSSAAPYQW